MNKHTMMLELKGLSRVIDDEVRYLVLRLDVLDDIAEDYEPVNPFHEIMDRVNLYLQECISSNIEMNLSAKESSAFKAQWEAMNAHEQFTVLLEHVDGGEK